MAMSLKLELTADEEIVSSKLLQNFATSIFKFSFSIKKPQAYSHVHYIKYTVL